MKCGNYNTHHRKHCVKPLHQRTPDQPPGIGRPARVSNPGSQAYGTAASRSGLVTAGL